MDGVFGTHNVAHDLVVHAAEAGRFPLGDIPRVPVSGLDADVDEIERIAGQVRATWQLPTGPINNVVDLLEAHGVVVIRLPLGSADVDAFSLPFHDHPVVVLGTDKNDRARSRFDAAHELGHLVLHGEQIWGVKQVEDQAHRFAAALLMPADEIEHQLPSTVDWPRLFELKRHWQVFLAAILMRARTLRCMNENTYLTAIKAASARGWRRVEPSRSVDPNSPECFWTSLVRRPAGELDSTCRAVSSLISWPPPRRKPMIGCSVVARMIANLCGRTRTGPEVQEAR